MFYGSPTSRVGKRKPCIGQASGSPASGRQLQGESGTTQRNRVVRAYARRKEAWHRICAWKQHLEATWRPRTRCLVGRLRGSWTMSSRGSSESSTLSPTHERAIERWKVLRRLRVKDERELHQERRLYRILGMDRPEY